LRKNKASRQIEWVDRQVQAYLTKERQFLRKLMVCMHVTGKLTAVNMPRGWDTDNYRRLQMLTDM
jgi:hypothetical protein